MPRSALVLVCLASCVLLQTLAMGRDTAARVKRSDDGGPLQVVVDDLTQQVTSLTAQLASVNAKLAVVESKTTSLGQVVAFYAWSTSHIHTAAMSPLIFNHIVTNVGHGLDPLTGVFIVPVTGLYDFQASFMDAVRSSDSTVRAALYVDNQIRAISISDSRNTGLYDHGTMRAVVHVTAQQRVYVKNPDNADHDYFDETNLPYTTFSGVLIKAD